MFAGSVLAALLVDPSGATQAAGAEPPEPVTSAQLIARAIGQNGCAARRAGGAAQGRGLASNLRLRNRMLSWRRFAACPNWVECTSW